MTVRMWHEISAAEQKELWQRWRGGESVTQIARHLGRPDGSLRALIRRHGGFAPSPRQRAQQQLSLVEREEISRGVCAGMKARQIARSLGRSPSTICRELARNGGPDSYRAARADRAAWDRARRPKPCVLARRTGLAVRVAQKLRLNWSPQQISQWLEIEFAGDETMRVSPETIYRSLFIQARGVLKSS